MPTLLPGPLPIDALLPDIDQALAQSGAAVVQAPPGAGKTTRIPLRLLNAPWLEGRRLIMLEPRRLAARSAAERMASELGEEVGGTVGYRVRLDSRVSARTRVEVVTEGIFLRQLQGDPGLEGIGAVLFDEVHERSLDSDLSLALTLQSRAVIRPDLRLVAMSATLDGAPLARLMGDAPMVTSEGRLHPVETRYAPPPAGEPWEPFLVRTIRRVLMDETGSILVFLPGGGEIRRVERLLAEQPLPPNVDIAALSGDLSLAAQNAAVRAAPQGRRKVVLATAIAETSLTIDGVRVVIDAGFARLGQFDPRSGMGRLETVRVSRAAADQRRGRAGRTEPGVCVRLWSEAADRALIPFTTPEILRADLAGLALELAAWGAHDPHELAWIDPPPAGPLKEARALLRQLNALDEDGRITTHGRAMAQLGLHPRLAHMVLAGKERGFGALACRLAILLSERDPLRGDVRDVDLRRRLDLLSAPRDGRDRGGGDPGVVRRLREAARLLERHLGVSGEGDPDEAGRAVALAYPDRIALRRAGGDGRYILSNGKGAVLDPMDSLAREELLAVAELDGGGTAARIFLAAPLDRQDLERDFATTLRVEETVVWDPREEAVVARRRRRLFTLILKDEPLTRPSGEAETAAVLDGIRQLGLSVLPWRDDVRQWLARVAFVRRMEGGDWPDLSEARLAATLDEWLAPHLAGITRRTHFERIDLRAALSDQLAWQQRQALDRLAPSHLAVPSGSRLPIDYTGDEPVLAVRLQALFGLAETPRVAEGRVPVLLHLLSPAHRPVQVTRDLAGFWAGSYRDVRKDLAGRYPKHSWPDDPMSAEPTSRAKRRAPNP